MAESTQDATTAVTERLRQPRFIASYELELPAIMEVPREEWMQINLDIPTAVTLVLGAVPGMQKLRDRCAKALPELDLGLFERIESLALAMGYAHSRQKASALPALPVQQLSERVIEMRDTLIVDWTPYARRGWMDAQRIKDLKGPIGYKNQAFDLLTLVAMGREAWPQIQGKTAITLADLDEAESLADQLLTAVGEREQLPAETAPSKEILRAAFTLFMRAYAELRRAALYVRFHEDDADKFVPPLTAGRKRKGSEPPAPEADEIPQPASTAQTMAKPEPTKNGGGAPVGMPGSDPFVNA
jgi:hypothetical protein